MLDPWANMRFEALSFTPFPQIEAQSFSDEFMPQFDGPNGGAAHLMQTDIRMRSTRNLKAGHRRGSVSPPTLSGHHIRRS